jgi:hypothetical protein
LHDGSGGVVSELQRLLYEEQLACDDFTSSLVDAIEAGMMSNQ